MFLDKNCKDQHSNSKCKDVNVDLLVDKLFAEKSITKTKPEPKFKSYLSNTGKLKKIKSLFSSDKKILNKPCSFNKSSFPQKTSSKKYFSSFNKLSFLRKPSSKKFFPIFNKSFFSKNKTVLIIVIVLFLIIFSSKVFFATDFMDDTIDFIDSEDIYPPDERVDNETHEKEDFLFKENLIDVNSSKAYSLINKYDFVIFDLRTIDDYSKNHIPKALFYQDYDCSLCDFDIYETYKDKKILVYDNDGNNVSIEICKELLDEGFKKIYRLKNGFNEWLSSGYPVETAQVRDVLDEIDTSLEKNKAVFLYFYSPSCGFCNDQTNVLDELKNNYSEDIEFISLNSGLYPDVFKRFKINSYPTMFFIKDKTEEGFVYRDFVGFHSLDVLNDLFIKYLDDALESDYWRHGDLVIRRAVGLPLEVARDVSNNVETRVIIRFDSSIDFSMKKTDDVYNDFEEVFVDKNSRYVTGVLNQNRYNSIKFDEEISGIYPDNVFSVFLDESLPLINYDKTFEEFGLTGAGVKICILDTGVDSSIVDFSYGYDFVNNDDDVDDVVGHGTRVASVIKSIAPDSELIVAKVIGDTGIGYESNVIRGLEWCMNEEADVISFSIGTNKTSSGFCDSNLVASIANTAVDDGMFVVAAAGNTGSRTSISGPACGSNVFSVGATDKDDIIADFSNVNPILDLFAPGVNIDTDAGAASGTSMSAPHVAGAAALILEQEFLSPVDLKNRFRSTGFPIFYKYNDSLSLNISRLDIFNAVTNNVTMSPFDYSNWWQSVLVDETYTVYDEECASECDSTCGWTGSCGEQTGDECAEGRCGEPACWLETEGCLGSKQFCICEPSEPEPETCADACEDLCGAGWTGECDEQPLGLPECDSMVLNCNGDPCYHPDSTDYCDTELDEACICYGACGDPDTTIDAIPDPAYLSDVENITGNATADNPCTIAGVYLTIENETNTKCWTGEGWGACYSNNTICGRMLTAHPSDGSFNSANEGWYYEAGEIWVDGKSYTITAKAKDSDDQCDPTAAEASFNFSDDPDTDPPTPDPMTFDTAPFGHATSSIRMIATTATDDTPPVEYFFDFMSSETGGTGGSDSSWQSNTNYEDSGLQENHQYSYRVRARDSVAPTPNVGNGSSKSSAFTLVADPNNEDFQIDSYGVDWVKVTVVEPPNPTEGGTAGYFEMVTGGSANSGWTQTRSGGKYYHNFTGLEPDTLYGFRVRLRNGDGVVTAWTDEKQVTTEAINISISVTPSFWQQGNIEVGESNETTGGYFSLTNNGNVDIDVFIKASNATNATAGLTWVLSNDPGHDLFSLRYKIGAGSWINVSYSYNYGSPFVSSLSPSDSISFDFKLIAATTTSSLHPLDFDITFKSVAST